MRILFAISVLCLLVLLWAALAIRRHVLAAASERKQQRERPSTAKSFEAELKSELRRKHVEEGFFGSVSDPQPGRQISRIRQAVRDSALRAAAASQPAPSPEVARPAERAAQPVETAPQPAATVQPISTATVQIHAEDATEPRKPPVPVSISGVKVERMDWAHYNKDLGDLSDPYQVPRTATRNRS